MSTRTPGPDGGSNAVSVPPDGRAGAVGRHRLHVDARLDGDSRAAPGRRLRRGRGRRASAPAASCELGADEVDAGHLLGDGVLDLQARVGLDEDEARRAVGVDEELERAEVAVAGIAAAMRTAACE